MANHIPHREPSEPDAILTRSAGVLWTPRGQPLSLISSVVSCTSQARSRRNAHPDHRASATRPAYRPRTSWPCQGSALPGTSSGSPTAPSPTRSSPLQAQICPHHPPVRLPLCRLGMPGKVRACGFDLVAASLPVKCQLSLGDGSNLGLCHSSGTRLERYCRCVP